MHKEDVNEGINEECGRLFGECRQGGGRWRWKGGGGREARRREHSRTRKQGPRTTSEEFRSLSYHCQTDGADRQTKRSEAFKKIKIGKIAEIRGQEKERAKVGKDANKRFFTISHWPGAGAWRGERHISCCLWLRCCQVAERTYRMYIQKVAPILALFFIFSVSLYYDFSSSSSLLYSRSSDSHSCQIIKREV